MIVERYHFWCFMEDMKINLFCQKCILNGNFSGRKGRGEFNSDRWEECVKSVEKNEFRSWNDGIRDPQNNISVWCSEKFDCEIEMSISVEIKLVRDFEWNCE